MLKPIFKNKCEERYLTWSTFCGSNCWSPEIKHFGDQRHLGLPDSKISFVLDSEKTISW